MGLRQRQPGVIRWTHTASWSHINDRLSITYNSTRVIRWTHTTRWSHVNDSLSITCNLIRWTHTTSWSHVNDGLSADQEELYQSPATLSIQGQPQVYIIRFHSSSGQRPKVLAQARGKERTWLYASVTGQLQNKLQ